MQSPRQISQRVERIAEFHEQTKFHIDQPAEANIQRMPDEAMRPSIDRVFDGYPEVVLPRNLRDEPDSPQMLLSAKQSSTIKGSGTPVADLRMLATWLYMAYGNQTARHGQPVVRTCSSVGSLYPCEIYLAALNIDGLDRGLYHFSPARFTLRKLRDGIELISLFSSDNGAPFRVENTSAVALVSTLYWRSAWRYQRRGYRTALIDAGKLTQNLATAAVGLGLSHHCRLKVDDGAMRQLIGVSPEVTFGEEESVQAAVAWITGPQGGDDRSSPDALSAAPPLESVPRAPLGRGYISYASVLAVHQDCVSPGAPLHIRSPITEASPLLKGMQPLEFFTSSSAPVRKTLRQILVESRPAERFMRRSINRTDLVSINTLSLHSSTYWPIAPAGKHLGLIRPYWLIHDVVGMASGVWFCDPVHNRWSAVFEMDIRRETAELIDRQAVFGHAASVCVFVANLGQIVAEAGPDAYRIAQLEAGIAAQRMYLTASAIGLAWSETTVFFDDEIKMFLGLAGSGWQPLHVVAIGIEGRADEFEEIPDDVKWERK